MLADFARQIHCPISEAQARQLVQYAQLVWQKKEVLNLTSVAHETEILTRHICDGLQGAACVQQLAAQKKQASFSLIDAGAGAGYIGLTIAVSLPHAQVTLIESIEKRCAFMNWVIWQLGLKNACVKNVRLGQQKDLQADFVTERAMGQLDDILTVCLGAVKPGGAFVAYQSQAATSQTAGRKETVYTLPEESRERKLVIFTKDGK